MSFTMGLYVMPKHKKCGPAEVYTVEEYFNYQRTTNEKISFVEWYKNKSGFDNYSNEELVNIFTEEMLEFYSSITVNCSGRGTSSKSILVGALQRMCPV